MYQAFWDNERGGSAVVVGVMAVPIILALGLGVDFASMSRDRALVQGIADRATLAAASLIDASNDEITKAVNGFIADAKTAEKVGSIDKVTVSFPDKDRINVKIDAHTSTSLLNLVSDRYSYSITTETYRGVSGEMEVVFALDNTGSMLGTKLSTLKTAAKKLVETLSADAGAKVKYGLVPFAQYVNVGVTRRGAACLDVAADTSSTSKVCKMQKPVIKKTNCVTLQKTVVNDGVETLQNYQSCDIQYGPEQEVCSDVTTKSTWSGCVGSRNAPLNVSTDSPSTRYPGIMNVTCGRALTPLTEKTGTINAEIDAMAASGETYLPSGLLWGLNMLTPGGPASEAAAFDPDGRNLRPHKALVLMTDGENTKSPNFPTHNGSNKTLANQYTTDLCKNIKAKNIRVYTVAFQVTDVGTKSMLQSCATDGDHFFDATDASGLVAAFSKIAQSLKQVRLSR